MTASQRHCLMNSLINRLCEPLAAATLIALICMISLSFALIMQYVFNHAPCELCLWQRAPYIAAECLAISSAILAILANSKAINEKTRANRSRLAAQLLSLCAVIFLIGAAIAFYHSGVERHWWQSATSCSLPPLRTDSAGLRDQLLSMPVVRCDEIGWSVLGLTMANINAPFSLALAAFCFRVARKNCARGNAK